MKAIGRIYEVTDVNRFILTYLADPANPDHATYKPIPAARIHIGSALPLPGFFPSITVKTETDQNGVFEVDCSNLPAGIPAYLVAYRQLQVINTFGMTVPIYGPVFRSQTFQLAKIDSTPRNIYVIQKELPNEQGIKQEKINEQIAQAKERIADIDSISAAIQENGINVVGKGQGATITFRITLSPSTSHDLDLFVTHSINDFNIDLPGPDWITYLCVNEDDIENEVRDGVRSLLKMANQQIEQNIITGIVQSTGQTELDVRNLFKTRISVTFNKIRYPIIETSKIGWITFNFRAIVPDVCLGIPKILYTA
jgi:hypothetical protein